MVQDFLRQIVSSRLRDNLRVNASSSTPKGQNIATGSYLDMAEILEIQKVHAMDRKVNGRKKNFEYDNRLKICQNTVGRHVKCIKGPYPTKIISRNDFGNKDGSR